MAIGFLQEFGIGGATLLMLGMIVGLLTSGLPLAFVTGLVGLFFTIGWFGPTVVPLITERVYTIITEYSLVAVPMFVLMASLLDRSGIARDLFNSLRVFAGGIRGGVAVQTVIVAFVVAAMSGIIGGEIVLLGIIALPQMLRLGYAPSMAVGTICAGGSLGTMVPPSIVLIIYGLVTSTSISDLFLATVPAALMLSSLYIIYILVRCNLNPALGPGMSREEIVAAKVDRATTVRNILAPMFIATSVLGSIYAGIASVTEAASMGVVGVLIVIALRRELTLKVVWEALIQTFNTCGMVIWIVIGASIIVGIYNLMGGNQFVANLITGMNLAPVMVILFMMAILIVLGMFLDWTGIVMLCMPIFIPVVELMGMSKIWFGILFAVNMQVSFLSPPFGPAAFFLKSVAPPDINLGMIFKSLIPFIGMQIIVLAILIAFPESILWIVSD